MLETAIYLVTEEIAKRSGLIESRYRIADGRFVLNDRDLSRVRFTPDEYINGLKGVERIDTQQAKTLIRRNKYQLGMVTLGDSIGDESNVPQPKEENNIQEKEE